MRSKTSFFNLTLYKKNLSRFWPLWALSSFAGAMVPLTMLMQLARLQNLSEFTEISMTSAYLTVLTIAVPVVSLLYAVLCGAAVWSYLDNPRSAAMMHRLPIRREGLFVTNFLSGMTMMLIPYVVTGALTVLLSALTGAMAWKALLITILGVLGESFFYFSSATFAAFLTGHFLAMPVLYFLLHFLQPLVYRLVQLLQRGFYFGVLGSSSSAGDWLCPTMYLVNHTQAQFVYEDVTETVGDTINTYSQVADVKLLQPWLIGAYAAAGVVLLALAWVLYRKRNSENAGDVAAVGWMRPVFCYGGTLLVGITGGMLLYNLVWRPFQKLYGIYEALPLAVCMMVMGLIGYYAVSMVLEKSLRVFRKKTLPGAILSVVLLAGLCGTMEMDLFHVEAAVPGSDEVKQIELYTDNNNYTLTAGKQEEQIQQVLELHQTIVDQLDHIRAVETTRHDLAQQEEMAFVQVDLVYILKNGHTLHRQYDIWACEPRMEQPETWEYKLMQLLNDQEMKRVRLKLDGASRVISGTLNSPEYDRRAELTPSQAELIREAVARDAAAGRWGRVVWFSNEEETVPECLATVEMDLLEHEGTQEEDSTFITLNIRPDMPETITVLRQQGLLTEDLQVVEQLGTEGTVTEELTVGERSESTGLIGGADGSTAAVVTGG